MKFTVDSHGPLRMTPDLSSSATIGPKVLLDYFTRNMYDIDCVHSFSVDYSLFPFWKIPEISSTGWNLLFYTVTNIFYSLFSIMNTSSTAYRRSMKHEILSFVITPVHVFCALTRLFPAKIRKVLFTFTHPQRKKRRLIPLRQLPQNSFQEHAASVEDV